MVAALYHRERRPAIPRRQNGKRVKKTVHLDVAHARTLAWRAARAQGKPFLRSMRQHCRKVCGPSLTHGKASGLNASATPRERWLKGVN